MNNYTVWSWLHIMTKHERRISRQPHATYRNQKEYPKTATCERISKMANLLFSVTLLLPAKVSLRKLCFDYNSIQSEDNNKLMNADLFLIPSSTNEKIVVNNSKIRVSNARPTRSALPVVRPFHFHNLTLHDYIDYFPLTHP